MKSLKILACLFIMLGFALTAKSQGKQVERPINCSFYARVTESYGTYEVLTISGNATHPRNVMGSEMKF
jgi:hypothetical protein